MPVPRTTYVKASLHEIAVAATAAERNIMPGPEDRQNAQ